MALLDKYLEMQMRNLLGEDARHLPINLILQDTGDGDAPAGEGIIAGVVQARHPNWRGWQPTQKFPHILIAADAFIRPHHILGTRALLGGGISQLFRSGFIDRCWGEGGESHDLLSALRMMPTSSEEEG